jgi:hypothetical protein
MDDDAGMETLLVEAGLEQWDGEGIPPRTDTLRMIMEAMYGREDLHDMAEGRYVPGRYDSDGRYIGDEQPASSVAGDAVPCSFDDYFPF